jgi:hypothetical protein
MNERNAKTNVPQIIAYEILMQKENEWGNKRDVLVFSLGNFSKHIIKDNYNYGNSFNLGAGKHHLVFNWYNFNKFKVYVFCPVSASASPFNIKSCTVNAPDKYDEPTYSVGLPSSNAYANAQFACSNLLDPSFFKTSHDFFSMANFRAKAGALLGSRDKTKDKGVEEDQ